MVLDTVDLRTAGEASRVQVDEQIGANPDHLEMVRRLEAAIDSEEGTPLGFASDLPSGDAAGPASTHASSGNCSADDQVSNATSPQ